MSLRCYRWGQTGLDGRISSLVLWSSLHLISALGYWLVQFKSRNWPNWYGSLFLSLSFSLLLPFDSYRPFIFRGYVQHFSFSNRVSCGLLEILIKRGFVAAFLLWNKSKPYITLTLWARVLSTSHRSTDNSPVTSLLLSVPFYR